MKEAVHLAISESTNDSVNFKTPAQSRLDNLCISLKSKPVDLMVFEHGAIEQIERNVPSSNSEAKHRKQTSIGTDAHKKIKVVSIKRNSNTFKAKSKLPSKPIKLVQSQRSHRESNDDHFINEISKRNMETFSDGLVMPVSYSSIDKTPAQSRLKQFNNNNNNSEEATNDAAIQRSGNSFFYTQVIQKCFSVGE